MIQSSVTSPSHCSYCIRSSSSSTSRSGPSIGDVIDHEMPPPVLCHVTGSDLTALHTLSVALARGHSHTLLPLIVSPTPWHVDSLLSDHPRAVTADRLPTKRPSSQRVADVLIQAAPQHRAPANSIAERLRLLTGAHWPSERPNEPRLAPAPTPRVTGLSADRHPANVAITHREVDSVNEAGSRPPHVAVSRAASVWTSSLFVRETRQANRSTTAVLNDLPNHRHHRHNVTYSTGGP